MEGGHWSRKIKWVKDGLCEPLWGKKPAYPWTTNQGVQKKLYKVDKRDVHGVDTKAQDKYIVTDGRKYQGAGFLQSWWWSGQ